MSAAPRRVAVIGAGHNGLVAAVDLARAGVEVTVLEANEAPGGCIWTETLPSGHRLERGALEHGGILDLALALGLDRHGLEFTTRDTIAGTVVGERRFVFPVDADAAAAGLGADGPAYRELVSLADSLFGLIDRFSAPPTLAELGGVLARLPGGDELFRLLMSSSEVVLRERLTDPDLVAAVAMYGGLAQMPPWLQGTGMFSLLLPSAHAHAAARPLGGSVALVTALVAALEAAGGRLVTGRPVTAITAHGAGARVAAGELVLEVDAVVSSIDLGRTVELLTDPPAALARAAARVGSGRINVGECKLDVALDHVPDLGAIASAPDAIWLLQRERTSLRRSTADVVAGRLPDDLPVMLGLPSVSDPSAAPAGGAVVWVSAFVPLEPREGWTSALEEATAARMVATVRATTGIELDRGAVTTRVTGPRAWAERMGSATGNPNHLDLSLDQLLGWRPPGVAGSTTALPWLHLAGAGTHPGGGLSGVSGRRAAAALLGRAAGRGRGPVARLTDEVGSLTAGLRFYLDLRRRGR
ncbi:MAG: hypothetical protein RLZZ272_1327 [Actinomycetota bacterium]